MRETGTQLQRGEMALNKNLLIMTLKVNEINVPIKRQRVAKLIRKHGPHISCLTREPPHNKRPTQAESEGLEKIFQVNRQGKKSQGSNTYIRQNRFQNKGHKKR